MSDLLKILAANITHRREAAGLSMRQVGDRGGIAVANVSRIEGGQDALLSSIERIARGLGCTVTDLLTPPACMTCFGAPRAGFTCNECGAGGTS